MKMTGKCALSAVLLLGLVLVLSGEAAAVDSRSPDGPLDPIVAQVIEMLNAGVSDVLILQWLESTDRRPVDVGSQGLIALTEAEASEQLISSLLELVEEQHSAEALAASEPSAEPAEVDTEAPPPSSPTPAAKTGDGTRVLFELSAKRIWTDEDEPDAPREPRWNVFLYLDGEFVAWTRPTQRGEPVEAGRILDNGRREMRVVLQRYEELRKRWHYESLSIPTPILFDVTAGDPIEVEVDLKRIWGLWRNREDGGPMSYVIRQGDQILGESTGTGGNPDRWQPICEDVEANFPDAEGIPRAFRSAMNRCVRWADLWEGAGASTSRTEILAELEEHDFEPPVR